MAWAYFACITVELMYIKLRDRNLCIFSTHVTLAVSRVDCTLACHSRAD